MGLMSDATTGSVEGSIAGAESFLVSSTESLGAQTLSSALLTQQLQAVGTYRGDEEWADGVAVRH